MSGYPSVGTSGVYEAGDQRNAKRSEMQQAERYNEGQHGSHIGTDSKDQCSIANRLAAEERRAEPGYDTETSIKKDPTLPAKMHGNEPSKGAKVDAELVADDEEYLRRKSKA
ncbi:uncharacterized protein TRIVIDRAFT_161869 [Trichoderma virens Gv29-8]|uniref:Uncharacterized protein n=1 Tax=Hypocrea virens (strain Gv29-8 / FGSC 10586) TaxID=413071 RepID=G9N7M6_HYPVG|nr:uncharacterized protein TRIVIDRAFT_161869 [Trichoderma virens Gv29-8]EHK16992.1 hypothetical protein TRIVIDRAFT_161869 [Trichoderma virens Gv29-8]UKZ55403.1 hypothetical protein TrVGV298_009226 [Trichoderma virens]